MLLSGIWDDGTTAAQLPVDVKKTNEIPVFRELLKKIPDQDLAGAVITADQMHTQRGHARLIDREGGHFVFTIGENQPGLFAAADALCWESLAVEAWTVDRGHGRIDVRTIKTMPATERITALFPHVRHVFLVERYSYGTDGSLLGAVAVLGITSLAPDQAGPGDLLAYLRGHWAIEMHHYVRDVCFGEDASRVSRAHQAKAAIRNTVIGILHLHRIPNIAAQLRINHRDPTGSRCSSSASPTPGAANRKPRRDLNTTIPPHPERPFHRPCPDKSRMTSINTNQPPDPLNKQQTLQAPCHRRLCTGSGREGLKQSFRMFWDATPGRHEIEDQVAEGDKVVTRLTAYGVHERDLPGSLPPAARSR